MLLVAVLSGLLLVCALVVLFVAVGFVVVGLLAAALGSVMT